MRKVSTIRLVIYVGLVFVFVGLLRPLAGTSAVSAKSAASKKSKSPTGLAGGEQDGVSTYKSSEYASVASVFADGAKVYVSVMDWYQTFGGRSTASATYGAASILLDVFDDGTSPDPKAGDGIYWGVFTVGTGATDDAQDYLHLPDGEEATITADVGDDGTTGTATILAYYTTNPMTIVVNPGDSIQDAINNLPPAGGIVSLAAGVHNVANTIVVNKGNITVEGTHNSEIRFQGAANKHLFEIPHLGTDPGEDWKNKPVLNNLNFKGFKTTNTFVGRSGSIVRAWNVRHITVEDILDESDNFYGGFLGLHTTGGGTTAWGENIFIKNNRAKFKGHMNTAFCKNSHMVGNYIPRAENVSAINVNRTQQFVYVRNNYSANSANHCIRLHGANYVHCCGNTCVGSREGIWGDAASPAIVVDNTISNVTAPYGSGAGIFINPQFTLNWRIVNNRIYNCRRGIYTRHYSYGFSGHKTRAEIINNVIYGCSGDNGDGIKMDSPYVALDIVNNIITNNARCGISYMNTTELPTTIKYNNVWQNASGNYEGTSAGTGDISVDPLFADTANKDFHIRSKTGRWDPGTKKWVKDTAHSPCIDSGNPSDDYSHEPKPSGGRINMGAYGNTDKASKSAVVGRHVFYNNSSFDGNDTAANANDDGAVAPDKTALLPGGTATFANYTSYSRGINGIMVDVVGLPGTPTASDFTFKVGNDSTPTGWADAPAPTSITVRPGAGLGGSDRITIVWADGEIKKQWLQVTVKATTATGLASDDVFYFGNAIGETGNSATDATVKPTDEVDTRNNPHSASQNPADIDDAYDFNRDKKAGPTDEILSRNNGTNSSTALKLITIP